MSTVDIHADGHADDNGHHHDPHVAHHFETADQQYTSGKLGMWMFLGTEVLMFGGLFCAYAVYRHNHPEVFEYAHQYLDRRLGAINTIILITSSLTMAWGVRAAQMGNRKLLVPLLALTILGGFGFMGIKTIEYSTKWREGIFVGSGNKFYADKGETNGKVISELEEEAFHLKEPEATAVPVMKVEPDAIDPNAGTPDAATIKPPNITPAGLAAEAVGHPAESHLVYKDLNKQDRHRVYTFFAVYFFMTGLHGVHVVVGMGLIAWILWRATKNEFGPTYFTPVDLVGLYWHLVDLIWIFLFPLLYLIH
jgi:cytochrome c oxidase subunit 3